MSSTTTKSSEGGEDAAISAGGSGESLHLRAGRKHAQWNALGFAAAAGHIAVVEVLLAADRELAQVTDGHAQGSNAVLL